LYNFSCLL